MDHFVTPGWICRRFPERRLSNRLRPVSSRVTSRRNWPPTSAPANASASLIRNVLSLVHRMAPLRSSVTSAGKIGFAKVIVEKTLHHFQDRSIPSYPGCGRSMRLLFGTTHARPQRCGTTRSVVDTGVRIVGRNPFEVAAKPLAASRRVRNALFQRIEENRHGGRARERCEVRRKLGRNRWIVDRPR